MVTCEVCGTANEPKLTFCRNCGHRLLGNKSRAIPPTPATGMPRARQRSEDELTWERPPDEVPPPRMSRPSAPPLLFGKGDGQERARVEPTTGPLDIPKDIVKAVEPPVQVMEKEPEPVPMDKISCSHCGALSPKSYRFCISCGAVLKKAANKAPIPEPTQPPSRRQPPPPRSKPEPMRAVEEEIAPLETDCPRCGGACKLGETFCKHCGAPLGKPAPAVDAARRRQVSDSPDAAVDLTNKVAEGEPFPLADGPSKNRPRQPGLRSPVPSQQQQEVTGKLVVIVEDGSEGRALELRGRQVDIGSQDGDIVLTEDRYLSPRHARFFRQEGYWYLRDLDSVNGVYRRLRKPTPLRDQDLVLLGLEVLEFDLVDHAERGLGHAIQHGVLVFGSPATTRRARLCQRTVEGVTRDVYHLVSDETTIGRETGDIVFTSDPFMSRRHAMITWDDEAQQYVLSDLNSSNGTYLAIRDDVRLEDGDYIRLGQHLFRVDLPRSKAR